MAAVVLSPFKLNFPTLHHKEAVCCLSMIVCVCLEIRPNHYKVAYGQLLTVLFLDGRQKAIKKSYDLQVEK